MEISKIEYRRILRTLELKAYRSVVDALRAQGTLTANKHEVLKSLAATLKIGEERYRSEMRRAANDDLLNTIAQSTSGKNTEVEWRAESMKKVPLTPMIATHTTFTVLADAISDIVSSENEKFSDSGELNNFAESYRCRNDENLEKYQSSKELDSLLKKRKDHHQNLIFSELENIKINNNYHPSPIKSGYIEISYDDHGTADQQDQSFSFDDTNSSFDTATFSSFEQSNPPKKNTSCENLEISETFNSKSRSKVRRSEKKNTAKKISPLNSSKIQNTGRTRNLRIKPVKKYTWNSVEIKLFGDEVEEKTHTVEDIDNKPSNDTNCDTENNQTSESSKESHVEISYSENNDRNSLKNRKSKQRNRNRTKFVRQGKIGRGRKTVKPDTVKEVPSRCARLSSRNARRRNYARIASGDYDLLEFEKIRKEKNSEVEEISKEEIEEDDDEIKETEDDSLSDSSAAPIEISYSNPAAPKISDYDLDGVSSTYTETDDDMKPHTFNLIPASRRLKMLKKRAASPLGEEIPPKKIALSCQLSNEQNVTPTAKTSLLDSNALKKVLAAQESSGNVTSSSLSDASDITDAKENLEVSDRTNSELRETHPQFLIPPRSALEKKVKPKMKLSEASTIENLHSLLSKVKEGDLKRFSNGSSIKKKSPRKKKDRKISPRPTSPIVNNCNESLIEVGSDNNLVNDNYQTGHRKRDFNNPIQPENGTSTNENVTPNNEVDDAQIDENMESSSEALDTEISGESDIQMNENVKQNDEEKSVEGKVTTVDDEDSAECNMSEQLIDIESADIIIGDSSDQKEEFVVTDDNASDTESKINNQHESTIEKPVKSVFPPTITIPNDKKAETKANIVILNSSFQPDSGSLAIVINDQNVVADSRQPIIKKLLNESADFRYKADSDDLLLKNSPSNPSHLVTTSSSGIPTIINSTKKFGKSSIKSTNAIIARDSITTNNGPNALQNKINHSNTTTNSTFNKDRKFVILDTKSIKGSKSLLKPIKILPNITIPSKTKTEANCIVRKPNTMGIYSSLENLNKFASSTSSSALKEVVVSKNSTNEMNSKRLVLSRVLERSLIETANNQLDTIDLTENIESNKNNDINTEIATNDSQKDDIISNLNEIETVLGDETSNNDSESISLTEGLNEMKTFFSKNIIRKQS